MTTYKAKPIWLQRLAEEFDEPAKAYSWFRDAEIKNGYMIFNGKNAESQINWVVRKYRSELRAAKLGKLKPITAKDYEKITHKPQGTLL